MSFSKRQYSLNIWSLAFGYFLTYIPYSSLTKAVTSGLWFNGSAISGVELLVPAAISTLILEFFFISAMGWWKYSTRRQLLGFLIPWPSFTALLSGLGYAAIIVTTTLTYSLSGVTILMALLLMRGGVLMMAPLIDYVLRRPVRWFSWAALFLSMASLLSALVNVHNFNLGPAAILTFAGYLMGYGVRLPCMSRTGKMEERTAKLRYFVDEQLVAMPTVLFTPLVWALFSQGSAHAIRYSFVHFFNSPATLPGLVIGIFYAGLGTFCTFIYLDRRENSFCIPMYSCSSLLAGVVATYGLHFFLHAPAPANSQIVGCVLMMSALLVLSPLHHLPEKLRHPLQRLREQRAVDESWVQSDGPEVGI